MGEIVLEGDPPITVRLRENRRARRLSLRVSHLDGRVTLSMPPGLHRAEALAFLREKEGWIRGHLARRHSPVVPRPGARVHFEGVPVPVVAGAGRSVRLEEGRLVVPGRAEAAPRRLGAFMRVVARERLAAACDRHAGRIGRSYGRITLRDTRSRWGSCTAQGRLMFSWRLVMAPPEVLDYVAAHEVAHLVELNHSPAYWAVVEGLVPDYREHRRWLRQNGAVLHRYRFDD